MQIQVCSQMNETRSCFWLQDSWMYLLWQLKQDASACRTLIDCRIDDVIRKSPIFTILDTK
jgi:hypothetical protein